MWILLLAIICLPLALLVIFGYLMYLTLWLLLRLTLLAIAAVIGIIGGIRERHA